MRNRMLAVLLIALSLMAVAPRSAHAGGVVSTCTQAGLVSALAGGGTVTFNCGPSPVTIPITSTLVLTANTTLDGGNLVTLDGGNTTRIIDNKAYLIIRNITLTKGRAQGTNTAANGSAILSESGTSLDVTNVTFSNNVTNTTTVNGGLSAGDFGGAIFTQGGWTVVRQSTFVGNQSLNGAGAAIHGLRSDVTVQDSTFTSNQITGGGYGGAIYYDGAQPTNGNLIVTGSTFTGNQSTNGGGAIHVHMYQANDQFTVDRSSFVGNSVAGGTDRQGGAISGGNGKVTITNSLFSGNSVGTGTTSDGSGGALAFAETAVITIANTTITGNFAYGSSYNANGGGVYIINNTVPFQIINSTLVSNYAGWAGGGLSSSATGTLKNTLVAYNTAYNGGNGWQILQQCSAKVTNGGNSLQYPPKNPNPNYYNEVVCADNLVVADPLLAPLANNGGPTKTRALLPGSPAIGAGSSAICAAAPVSGKDQRGLTRKTPCDMGAYELITHKKTVGLYRPTTGVFYLKYANTAGPADVGIVWGDSSFYPVVGDWNGDGVDTIGLYNQTTGVFSLRDTNTPGNPDYMFVLGNPNDMPLEGRWDNTMTHDGTGVFRPSNGIIYLKKSLTNGYADYFMILGNPGDIGLAGDWDGDLLDGPGVFRPSQGRFFLSNNSTATGIIFSDLDLYFGGNGDLPIAGDWTGLGHDGVGVLRGSIGTFWLRNSLSTGSPDVTIILGAVGDIPIAGRWTAAPIPPPIGILVSGSEASQPPGSSRGQAGSGD